jgi:hypothetical protein
MKAHFTHHFGAAFLSISVLATGAQALDLGLGGGGGLHVNVGGGSGGGINAGVGIGGGTTTASNPGTTPGTNPGTNPGTTPTKPGTAVATGYSTDSATPAILLAAYNLDGAIVSTSDRKAIGFVESVKSHSSGGIVLRVLLSKAIGAEIPYANILLRTAPRKNDVVQIGMTLNQFLKQL